jgi:hypothetical protein
MCQREETGLAQRTIAQCQSPGNALCNRADSAHSISRAARPGIPRQRRALPLVYRNFKRYFATVPSGMHPLGWGGHWTPPQPRAWQLAGRPAGSKPAAGWQVLPSLLAWGDGQQTPASRSGLCWVRRWDHENCRRADSEKQACYETDSTLWHTRQRRRLGESDPAPGARGLLGPSAGRPGRRGEPPQEPAGGTRPLTPGALAIRTATCWGAWGEEESAARAERSGAGAFRLRPLGAARGGKGHVQVSRGPTNILGAGHCSWASSCVVDTAAAQVRSGVVRVVRTMPLSLPVYDGFDRQTV